MTESQPDRRIGLPPALAHLPIQDIRTVFPKPTLIEIEGDDPQPLFLSTLLHGNETTSFAVLRHLASRYATARPRRSLMIFVGNVAATEAGLRHLPGEPDFNRIWADGPTPAHGLARTVTTIAREARPFASIDIHNNTGANPLYGCVNALRPADLHLAGAFAPVGVYYQNPPTTQSIAFSHFCPAVTIECGLSGNRDGEKAAIRLVEHTLSLGSFPDDPPEDGHMRLFETIGRVILTKPIIVGFGAGAGPDLAIHGTPESLNFTAQPKGTVFATNRTGTSPLAIVDEHGTDLTDHFLAYRDNAIVLKRDLVPAMLTTDEHIIREDCLCYFMERINS